METVLQNDCILCHKTSGFSLDVEMLEGAKRQINSGKKVLLLFEPEKIVKCGVCAECEAEFKEKIKKNRALSVIGGLLLAAVGVGLFILMIVGLIAAFQGDENVINVQVRLISLFGGGAAFFGAFWLIRNGISNAERLLVEKIESQAKALIVAGNQNRFACAKRHEARITSANERAKAGKIPLRMP